MKTIELKDKTVIELRKELVELRREQFSLRMQNATGQLETKHQLRRVRRDIARVKTLEHQKQQVQGN